MSPSSAARRDTSPTSCSAWSAATTCTAWTPPRSTRWRPATGCSTSARPPRPPATDARPGARGYRGRVRLATWNVNSVSARLPRLLPWLDERAPDVVCLQETKLSDEAFADALAAPLAERGYAVAHHGQGQWNGVALLSRVGLDDVA